MRDSTVISSTAALRVCFIVHALTRRIDAVRLAWRTVTIAAVLMLTASAWAQTASRPLLQAKSGVVPESVEAVASVRHRLVEADSLQLPARPGDAMRLNFFADFIADAQVDSLETFGPSQMMMSGMLVGDDDGRFVLGRVDDAVMLTAWTGDGRVFQVRPAVDGTHIAEQLDPDALPMCECASLPVARKQVAATASGTSTGPIPACAGPIDVLIVYTDDALNVVGSDMAMRALGYGAIASANVAFANSGINTRLRLADIALVDYEESNSFSTDLTRLSIGGDGYLDEVQPMRNLVRADLVCMFVASPVSCGVAFVMGVPSPGFEASAYSVVQVGCAIPTLSFAHELGHNFGCQHTNGDGTNGAFPYSFGYHFTGSSGRQWRTVMSSGSGQRVPHFSNPNVLFDGVATGIEAGLPGEADNARTINNTAALVASFRTTAAPDCDANGLNDTCEILAGEAADINDNGVPDECEFPACAAPLSTMIFADHAQSFDQFGTSIAVTPDGSRLIVGAPLHDELGTSAGTAYVFRNDNGRWIQEARLFGADTNPFDRFGHAVAISIAGNVVVIGAYRHAVFWPDAGAAYVFTRTGTTWTQQAMLSANDAAMTDLLGISAAISGDGTRIALGALWDDDGGPQSGSVYIFDRDGETWVQSQKIIAPDATPGSEFGHALALTNDGTRLVVGARFDDRFNTNFGAAYVFRLIGDAWTFEDKLQSPSPNGDDRFGTAVAIDERARTVIVGSPRDDLIESNAGAAHVFERRDGSWTWTGALTLSIAAAHKTFGTSTAVSQDGQRLVIGSAMDFTRWPRTLGGSATYFVRRGAEWHEIRRLVDFDSASNDAAGSAAAMALHPQRGSLAFIGWPMDDVDGKVDAGSVREFALEAACGNCCDFIAQPSAPERDEVSLLTIIANWGACPQGGSRCVGDLDHDGTVDVDDVLVAISGTTR